jgi:gamma-F420-2:alpha-L-glutamate ligase
MDWRSPLCGEALDRKPRNGGVLIENASQLKAYVGLLKGLRHRSPFIIQQFIGRPGEDLRVFVIGGKTIGAMKRKATDGDFRAGISANGEGSPFKMTPEVVRVSEAAAHLFQLEICGVDLFMDSDGSVVLSETNSAPGFAGFEKYCKVDIATQIATYVAAKLGLRKFGR